MLTNFIKMNLIIFVIFINDTKKVNFIYALNRGGGVEKNFVIISNYLEKIQVHSTYTADKAHSCFKKLIINPSLKLNSFYLDG